MTFTNTLSDMFPKGLIGECSPVNDICAQAQIDGDRFGDPGACIPTLTTVKECSTDFDACACDIVDVSGCRVRLSVIDVYMTNQTNERLHIVQDQTQIGTVSSDEDDSDEDDVAFGDKKFAPLVSDWISSEFSPPNVIESGETVLMRGVVFCNGKCCRSQVTFNVKLAYTIGLESKNLGEISASVSRVKDKESSGCSGDCKNVVEEITFELKRGFGDLLITSPAQINPPSQTYNVTSFSKGSQYRINVSGGGGGTGCSGNNVCPGNEICVQGICTGRGCGDGAMCPSGQKCVNNVCVKDNDTIDTSSIIIIVVVSVVALIIVLGFMYFLLHVNNNNKNSKQ